MLNTFLFCEILQIAKETLWSKFAYVNLKLYADGAEEKCAEVEYTDMSRLSEEDFQALKESLVERINMFERKMLEWEGLVSGTKTTVYKQQLYKLGNRLHDWAQSWQRLKQIAEVRRGEEAERAGTDEERGESGEGPTRPGMQSQLTNATSVLSTEASPNFPYTPPQTPQSIPGMHLGAYSFRSVLNEPVCLHFQET